MNPDDLPQSAAATNAGIEAMRVPFPAAYIGKLPKGTKAQNECAPSEKVNCTICGGWHHPRIAHLDYVGHAAITQRLLDADPYWSWEPLAHTEQGLPRFDEFGGLWIRLTVAGMTRLGYGDASGKHGPSATKEAIGDALRNAAMRFGAALELWHKGDWESDTFIPEAKETKPEGMSKTDLDGHIKTIKEAADATALRTVYANAYKAAKDVDDKEAAKAIIKATNARKAELAVLA